MSGPASYQPQLYSSTHSLQGQVNHSMPHQLLNYSSDRWERILWFLLHYIALPLICDIKKTLNFDLDTNISYLGKFAIYCLNTWGDIFSDQPILSRFPTSLASSHSRSNIQIYSQLQIPSTSNFGSMKKKKNGKRRSEEGAGDSPASEGSPSLIDQSHDASRASYVPDYITINNKPVKVWLTLT